MTTNAQHNSDFDEHRHHFYYHYLRVGWLHEIVLACQLEGLTGKKVTLHPRPEPTAS
jgi:hypothetical protein